MNAAAQRRPTIYDVAERAGVSKSLVSLVLRGSPQVRPARRDAVLAAMAELDYRPSQAATVLASTRTRTIEVLVDDYRNLSFVGIVRGMQEAVRGRGYHLTVTETPLDAEPERLALRTQVDGRVFAAEPTPALLGGWSGPTAVAGWRAVVPPGADFVASDDEQGGLLATTHLLDLGHRFIGHLSGPSGPAEHRRIGYRKGIRRAGLKSRVVTTSTGTTEQDGYTAAVQLLDRHPDTTALFAANDVMALGAMAAIRERGLLVPRDVSVVGYDNSPVAQSRYLDLTSVDDRSGTVGAGAAHALLARIEDPSAPRVHALVEPELIVRGTTGPA